MLESLKSQVFMNCNFIVLDRNWKNSLSDSGIHKERQITTSCPNQRQMKFTSHSTIFNDSISKPFVELDSTQLSGRSNSATRS